MLKKAQAKELEWNINRYLTKINYKIHTDSSREHLIPANIKTKEVTIEADLLNMALFAKRISNDAMNILYKKGNIRDSDNVTQRVFLANLERSILYLSAMEHHLKSA